MFLQRSPKSRTQNITTSSGRTATFLQDWKSSRVFKSNGRLISRCSAREEPDKNSHAASSTEKPNPRPQGRKKNLLAYRTTRINVEQGHSVRRVHIGQLQEVEELRGQEEPEEQDTLQVLREDGYAWRGPRG